MAITLSILLFCYPLLAFFPLSHQTGAADFTLKAFHKAILGTVFGAWKRGRSEANQVALTSCIAIGMNRDFHPDHQF